MRFRRHKPVAESKAGGRRASEQQTAPAPWQKEIRALRRRVAALEKEVQESRQLSKRLAEITDVVAEVLLPAEQRDEERLSTLLAKYESTL